MISLLEPYPRAAVQPRRIGCSARSRIQKPSPNSISSSSASVFRSLSCCYFFFFVPVSAPPPTSSSGLPFASPQCALDLSLYGFLYGIEESVQRGKAFPSDNIARTEEGGGADLCSLLPVFTTLSQAFHVPGIFSVFPVGTTFERVLMRLFFILPVSCWLSRRLVQDACFFHVARNFAGANCSGRDPFVWFHFSRRAPDVGNPFELLSCKRRSTGIYRYLKVSAGICRYLQVCLRYL